MADALCGPSSALQDFRKHTSVDRALQQDRLVARQSPQPQFRSEHGQHGRTIDPEFETFQAGQLPSQPETMHRFLGQHEPTFAVVGPASMPDWAADFQRLQVSPPLPIQQQQQQQQNLLNTQHNQDAYVLPRPSTVAGPSNLFYPDVPAMAFGVGDFAHHRPITDQQDTDARWEHEGHVYDKIAFENAFDAAAADMLRAEDMHQTAPQRQAVSDVEKDIGILLPPEDDQTLAIIREHAFHEYCRHRMFERLISTGKPQDVMVQDPNLASLYLGALELLESKGLFARLPPDPLLERALDAIADAQGLLVDDQFLFTVRATSLRDRIKSSYAATFDHAAWKRAIGAEDAQLKEARLKIFQQCLQSQNAGSTGRGLQLESSKYRQLMADFLAESQSSSASTRKPTPFQSETPVSQVSEHVQGRPVDEQGQERPQHASTNDDEALARTAGQLVDIISHDTSQRFAESRFLALMKQLRDREVRVDGDSIVETRPAIDYGIRQDEDLGRHGDHSTDDDDDDTIITQALQAGDADMRTECEGPLHNHIIGAAALSSSYAHDRGRMPTAG